MATTRELHQQPGALDMLLRAALPMIPGASRLPFVAGSGGEVPDTVLSLTEARLEPDRLAAYLRVCGFAPRDTLPATAPHLLAFGLHMALMTDGAFPVAPIGLVHSPTGSRCTADRRRRGAGRQRPRDRARAAPERALRSRSSARRASAGSSCGRSTARCCAAAAAASARQERRSGAEAQSLEVVEQWRLPEDLGRRYAAISGDRNPIHLHPLAARLLGFPRAIAHGMWTKARCLAALQATLPDAYTVQVDFRKPIFLPGQVSFASARQPSATTFAVRSGDDQTTIHLQGAVS